MSVTPQEKGKSFEDEVEAVLRDLEKRHPKYVTVTPQKKLILRDGTTVKPDFELVVRKPQLTNYYLIEVRDRAKNDQELLWKIGHVRAHSEYNTFFHIYPDKLEESARSPLERAGVTCFNIDKLREIVEMFNFELNLYGDQAYEGAKPEPVHYHDPTKHQGLTDAQILSLAHNRSALSMLGWTFLAFEVCGLGMLEVAGYEIPWTGSSVLSSSYILLHMATLTPNNKQFTGIFFSNALTNRPTEPRGLDFAIILLRVSFDALILWPWYERRKPFICLMALFLCLAIWAASENRLYAPIIKPKAKVSVMQAGLDGPLTS